MFVQLQITKAFLNKSSYSGSVTSEQSWLVNDYLFGERFSLDLRCIFVMLLMIGGGLLVMCSFF